MLALDSKTHVLSTNRSLAGTRFERIVEGSDATLHEQVHPGCDGSCRFQKLWKKAWSGIQSREGLEWEVDDELLGGRLRLTLSLPPTSRTKLFERRRRYVYLTITDITKYRQEYERLVEKHEALRRQLASLPGKESMELSEPTGEWLAANTDHHGKLTRKIASAQENERRRIAADLHDGIVQTLGVVKYGIEARLAGLRKGNPDIDLDDFAPIIEQIREIVEEVRSMSRRLAPAVLDEFGICVALDWLCKEEGSGTPGIEFVCESCVDESTLTELAKVSIYRVVQEALNNIKKYSSATRVEVILESTNAGMKLAVRDNGVGFNLDKLSKSGGGGRLGLRSMRDRVESTGGSFDIQSEPGKGTAITATWATTMLNATA